MTKRYRQIGSVLVVHGFGWLLAEPGQGDSLQNRRHRRGTPQVDPHTRPVHLRLALAELGATFIKLGQVLSTRPDLLPQEYVTELRKLQDDAPAVPYSDIAAIVGRELGGSPEDIFQEFDAFPRAAASLGQVHAAVLRDGTRVVVKVQRPGVEDLVNEDLGILSSLARLVSQSTGLGKQYDIEGWVEEFAFSLRNELDYTSEGRNADTIRRNFSSDPTVRVPIVHWAHTTRRVLTMEEIDGIKISDMAALDAAGVDRHAVAVKCAHIAVVQVLDHGFYHADPHPGNFFVMSDGAIGLLDYGLVGRVDDTLRRALLRLALAVSRQDADRLIDELLGLGAAPGLVNRQALKRDIGRLLRHYGGQSLGEISATRLFHDITSAARKHRLQLPSDLTLLVKVIIMDEGLGVSLDPDFNLVVFVKPYLMRFWRRSHSVHVIARQLREDAVDMAEMSLDLPQRLRRLSGQLDRGDLIVTTRMEVPEETLRAFQRAANRVAISVLSSGLIIGLSVVVIVYRPAGSHGIWHLLPAVLLGIGLVLGAWLVGAIWRSGR